MTYKQTTGVCTLASIPRLNNFVERFTKERQYLKGVTPSTLAWYRHSFQAFRPTLEREYGSASEFKAGVIQRIEELRAIGRGNSAIFDKHVFAVFEGVPEVGLRGGSDPRVRQVELAERRAESPGDLAGEENLDLPF